MVAIVGVCTDLTEHRSLESRARQSQKLEAVGTLAGGIAHDFNNIVAAILGNAELARSALGPEHPDRESIEHIAGVCGFPNRSYFTRVFARRTGTPPAAFRRKGSTALQSTVLSTSDAA